MLPHGESRRGGNGMNGEDKCRTQKGGYKRPGKGKKQRGKERERERNEKLRQNKKNVKEP